MKISRSSWHYKLYSRFSDNPNEPYNLCQYVGVFIGMAFRLLLIVSVIAVMIGLFFVFPFVELHWKGLYVMAGYVATPLIIWGIANLISTEKAGLVGEYIKAKKEGICPKIDLVD